MENPQRVVLSCVLLVLLLVPSALVLQVAADSEHPAAAYPLDDLSDLLPPTDLVAVGFGETHVDLSWQDNSSDETAFLIERSPDGSTGWHHVATVGSDVTSVLVSGIDCDGTYYHRVRAYRGGDGQYSAYSNAAGATAAPCRPGDLTATSLSETEIDLNWTDNSSSETEFRIERSLDASAGWSQIDTVGPNETSYHDSDLACSNLYYYRVRAHRGGDGMSSGASDQASAATTPCPPTGLQAAALSRTELRLTWQDNADDETAFHVERSPDGLSDWTQVGIAPAGAVSYTDGGLDCNSRHYYRVRAYRSDMDVVGAARVAGEIAWWENDGAGAFSKRTVATGFGEAYSVYAADVDGDSQHSEYSNVAQAATDLCPTPPPTWVVNTAADGGPGSLRQALLDAVNGDVIGFDPVVFPVGTPATILLTSGPLPDITQGHLTIDASNAGVILDGSGLGAGHGLHLASDGNVVHGLQILNFPEVGIAIDSAASHNTIGGINATPGGACTGQCNVIGGNLAAAIQIRQTGADYNVISGNYIGTDATGTSARPNGDGAPGARALSIDFYASYNVIGGITPGRRNLISGNDGDAVMIVWYADYNDVLGNYIGTDVNGTTALPNSGSGVNVGEWSQHNVIGGPNDSPGGLCSGACNLISGNGAAGLVVSRQYNHIIGNYIGTGVQGDVAIPNNGSGVHMFGGANHTLVGGNSAARRNLISGNNGDGVLIGDPDSDHNHISGNYIGLDVSGSGPLGNNADGVRIYNQASYNVVGGSAPGEGNVIGNHPHFGVDVNGPGTVENLVLGNLIGTNAAGSEAHPNGFCGVGIHSGAQYNAVGGDTPAERNLVSGNSGEGIKLEGVGTDHNVVQGNYIGTDLDGTGVLGNAWVGVSIIQGAQHNLVGGASPGQGNLIRGNLADGVYVHGYATLYNSLRANRIYDNGGQSILLLEGGNNEIIPPILTDVGSHAVLGLTAPGSIVDIYSGDDGEGRYYHGSTTADSSGRFTYTQAAPFSGTKVIATTTDPSGNTSEFSPGSGAQPLTISPDHGGNAGAVSVVIHGSGFPEVAEVKLARSGQPDIVGDPVIVGAGGWTVATTFDLSGSTPGNWDVVVTGPYSQTITLPEGFTIEQGGTAHLWVDVLGRSQGRAGQQQRFLLAFGNAGAVDLEGMALIGLYVSDNVDDVTVRVDNQLIGTFPPLVDYAGEGRLCESAPLQSEACLTGYRGILNLHDLPVGETGILEIGFPAPTEPGQDVTISVKPFHTRDPGRAIYDLVEAKARERGLPWPDFEQIFIDAFVKSLESAAKSLVKDLGAKVVVRLILFQHDEAVRELVEDALKNLESSFSNAVEQFRAQWTVLNQPENWKPTKSAMMANYEQMQTSMEWGRWVCKLLELVVSIDPNEKFGSQGSGERHYLQSHEPLRYTVLFENLASATAPAQTVVVTDQLDLSTMDLNTFSFGPIAFGHELVTPPAGQSVFTTYLSLLPEKDLWVRIEGDLDTDTGLLTWRFTAIDPDTGELTADPLAGFLPPNVNPPEGEGSVLFTVMPNQGLPAGTEIRNQASIVFDANLPVDTQEWLNTLDDAPPSSQVLPLAASQSQPGFTVEWSGTDEGSGILDYTLYASEDDGPYATWLARTTTLSATFTGHPGHTYAFFSVARDGTGNVEDSPAVADATTYVEVWIYLPLLFRQ